MFCRLRLPDCFCETEASENGRKRSALNQHRLARGGLLKMPVLQFAIGALAEPLREDGVPRRPNFRESRTRGARPSRQIKAAT